MKKKNRTSLSDLLNMLWKDGFFSEVRDLSEVKAGISAKGYNESGSSIAIALIRAVKSKGLLTRFEDSGKWKYIQKRPFRSPSRQRTELFAQYDLHPRIKAIAIKQFEDGYFKEAIQNAFVEVIDQVKIKANHPKSPSGRELDGDDLMNRVFGCDNQTPRIKFNDLLTSLDKAEQRGFMYLFKGIVGIRDKKAHLNFIQRDPLKTIEYLSLASLLMRLLDEATPRRKRK